MPGFAGFAGVTLGAVGTTAPAVTTSPAVSGTTGSTAPALSFADWQAQQRATGAEADAAYEKTLTKGVRTDDMGNQMPTFKDPTTGQEVTKQGDSWVSWAGSDGMQGPTVLHGGGAPAGLQDYYAAVGAGSVKPTSINDLFSSEDRALSEGEFNRFSPEAQAWAKSNPQAFMSDLLAHRSKANGDLASIGAEGGYSKIEAAKVNTAGTGLDYTNAGYMQIHDGGGLGFGGVLVGLAVAFMTGGAGLGLATALEGAGMSAMGAAITTGAINGAITSAITGGDIGNGILMGGAGGAISNIASGVEGGSNYMVNSDDISMGGVNGGAPAGPLNTSNLVRAGGAGVLAAAAGGNPIAAAGGSLAGSAVSNLTGSSVLGSAAGAGVGVLGAAATGGNAGATGQAVVLTPNTAPAPTGAPIAVNATVGRVNAPSFRSSIPFGNFFTAGNLAPA